MRFFLRELHGGNGQVGTTEAVLCLPEAGAILAAGYIHDASSTMHGVACALSDGQQVGHGTAEPEGEEDAEEGAEGEEEEEEEEEEDDEEEGHSNVQLLAS